MKSVQFVLSGVLALVILVGGSIAATMLSTSTTNTSWVYVNEGCAKSQVAEKCSTEYTSRFDCLLRSAAGTQSSSAGWDSCNAAADSSVLLYHYTPPAGVDVILQFGAFAGGGTDSIEVLLKAYSYNQWGVKVGQLIDTIKTADALGGRKWIQFNTSSLTGAYYKIVIVGGAANGGKLGLGPMELQAQRRVSYVR